MSKKPRTATTAGHMLWANKRGEILDDPGLAAVGRSGTLTRDIAADEMSLLPAGAVLHYLPDRVPLGRNRHSGKLEERGGKAQAVAVMLPNGWARTLLPAYHKQPGATTLPFYGYTAAALVNDEIMVAAVQTEDSIRWSPFQYSTPDLPQTVHKRLAQEPDNRLLAHHAKCALEYQCYNAQNIFYRRWEGAIALSPACNARCIGCISEQPEDMPPSPQQRLTFVPSLDDIKAIAVPHLQTPDSIISFGQGCEGEPLLRADLIADSIKAIRQETDQGTIHINTNASLPAGVQRLVEAGLDSIRVSLNSATPERYNAYYLPVRYGFDDVVKSVDICRDAGVQITINLLFFPGLNDLESEVETLERFIDEHGVHQVQMRNLNIDPDLYLSRQPPLAGRAIGVPALIKRLRQRAMIGNSTPPIKK